MDKGNCKPWEKISEETVFENQYSRLNKKTFILPHGKESDYFIHGTNEEIVTVFAITKDGKIILARQYRPGPEKVLDEIPGGLVDPGETADQAAERELEEETGYKGRMVHLGSTYSGAYSVKVRHCYIALDCEKMHDGKQEENEFIDVVLMSREDFEKQMADKTLTALEGALMGLRYLDSIQR
ncbi:NUDIX domain-containing protein [Candidatus Peregrinibacteria bacterium]|nr:NUDIX domain-containing protein [Candidatus Peregrinibacteria bacterium]